MSSPHRPSGRSIEAVVSRFAQLVRQVGWRHGLLDADLDELMQEVRIRLWKASERSEPPASIGASYVYRTAASAALDLIRRRRARREESMDPVSETGGSVNIIDPGPDQALESREVVEEIERALRELAESRRPVVRMYLAGYERHEIAALLGWTEARTRNLLYRGLADLRRLLTARGLSTEGRT